MWGTEKGPQESEVTTAPGATPTRWCSGRGFQPPGTPLCVCSLTGHTLAYQLTPYPQPLQDGVWLAFWRPMGVLQLREHP